MEQDKIRELENLTEYLLELDKERIYLEQFEKQQNILTEDSQRLEEIRNIISSLEDRYYLLKNDYDLNYNYDDIDIAIREKYNNYKSNNLKLLTYYKFYNKVCSIEGELTASGKPKKAYAREVKIDKKSPNKISNITGKTIAKVEMCACQFQALIDKKFKDSKVIEINRCNNKFCQFCAKINSTKTALALQTIYDYIKDTTDYKFIFLTLTQPNVPGEKLKDELEQMQKALRNFFRLKRISTVNRGYICKLEITYNKEREDYHPHYHILMAVPKSYISSTYISRNDWLGFWRQAKKDERITQVDVRTPKSKNNNIDNEILELSKYIAKDNDYLYDINILKVFYNSTFKKRFFKYGGIFKDAMQKFKNKELTEYKNEDYSEWDFIVKYVYSYELGKYNKVYLNKLSAEKKAEFKKREIEKLEDDFIKLEKEEN